MALAPKDDTLSQREAQAFLPFFTFFWAEFSIFLYYLLC